MHPLELRMPFFLAHLKLSLVQYLQNDVVDGSLNAEGFRKVGAGCGLPFGDGEEDGRDLEDIVKILFGA